MKRGLLGAVALLLGTASLNWGPIEEWRDRDLEISPALMKAERDSHAATWRAANHDVFYREARGAWLRAVDSQALPFCMAWLAHRGAALIRKPITYTIAANTTNHSAFTGAGSPSGPCDVTCIIATNIRVWANVGAIAGFRTAGFAAGSTFKLVNNGYVRGGGGVGGNGGGCQVGAVTLDGGAGNAGSQAIDVRLPMAIDNTNGIILGGGGGGGGGGAVSDSLPVGATGRAGGSGGGGGVQGDTATDPSAGGAGGASGGSIDGNAGGGGVDQNGAGLGGANQLTFWGTTGAGGHGGYWGLPGSDGFAATGGVFMGAGGPGGAAGRAVQLNGFAITWLGGNNTSQVQGPVS